MNVSLLNSTDTYQANQSRSQSSLRSILERDQVVGIWATFPIEPNTLSAPVVSHGHATKKINFVFLNEVLREDSKLVLCSFLKPVSK